MTESQTPPMPELPPARCGKDRRRTRAALRWTAVLAVFALTGAGTAYGISRADRADLPGLATRSDGRWEYPALVRPPLPSGSPGPLAAGNRAGTHYADLRALLLPAPENATVDKALSGADGWLPVKDFLAQYDGSARHQLGQELTDLGLRHVTSRGWTTPDGTRTRIDLLQFATAEVAEESEGSFANYAVPRHPLRGTPAFEPAGFPEAARLDKVWLAGFAETEPYGKEQTRVAYATAGDTVAMVTQSRPGGAAAVPFWQTVTLQSELLA
ncbi:hypothetical protein ACIPPM_24845 [Streptomyces sp. NPDC090119]|uniref:hypothetical protein n=1 Tax=Streptomyces sp. NPDC090119 TaxID=3365951 RepID=UPI0037F1B70F